MAKIDVLNLKGEKVSDLTLNDTIWNTEVNEIVLSTALKNQLSSLRQGTAKTKGRSEVSGGGRKPWRQKGTGRARQGSIRSPQWVGGGTVFGPTPRSYDKKMNKKEREIAIKSALSDKFLKTLKADAKTLIVTNIEDDKLLLATRNLENVLTINPANINVLAVVNANSLVIDVDSVKKIEEVLK